MLQVCVNGLSICVCVTSGAKLLMLNGQVLHTCVLFIRMSQAVMTYVESTCRTWCSVYLACLQSPKPFSDLNSFKLTGNTDI